ncbi:DUF2635 domain-containing protein [Nitratidesulfovibrio liaohensis]|uniref:DUF2635 domain-containing protein n=1 Tax=Nitratidesulfovibrio liaohensis TaxID=2604158 RepID=UPI0014204123|nr:DUF2635 domain-containing protein [Nitratidesulfovibrio liaohensis]NHZ48589.1 DUF2635 domain-containing protein [Nitratidesulfovibrio liaohensis]
MSAQTAKNRASKVPAPTFVIRPARPDDMVRDPETRKPLAEGGESKPRNSHWLRRLAAGDVVEVTESDTAPASKPGKKE